MTIKEFLDTYNYAPNDMFEIAELAVSVSDNEDFSGAAKALLEAKENIEIALDDIGFEFG